MATLHSGFSTPLRYLFFICFPRYFRAHTAFANGSLRGPARDDLISGQKGSGARIRYALGHRIHEEIRAISTHWDGATVFVFYLFFSFFLLVVYRPLLLFLCLFFLYFSFLSKLSNMGFGFSHFSIIPKDIHGAFDKLVGVIPEETGTGWVKGYIHGAFDFPTPRKGWKLGTVMVLRDGSYQVGMNPYPWDSYTYLN